MPQEPETNSTIAAPCVDVNSSKVFPDANSSDTIARIQQEAQEHAVGIISYASAGQSVLQCVFKQRYTDFLVNEILPSGEVLHLTEIAAPANKKQKKDNAAETSQAISTSAAEATDSTNTLKRPAEDTEEATAKRQKTETAKDEQEMGDVESATPVVVELSDDDKKTLVDIFGESVTSEIIKLYTAILTYPSRKPRDHILVKSEVIESKATRTQAHSAVRNIFKSMLETATLQEEPGRMTVRAAPPVSEKQSQNGREYNKCKEAGGRKGRLMWQELGGDYLHFTLYKENKDTMEVLYFLASQLKLKINTFQFAGTKDRRGVTAQRVAVYRIQKERLLHLTRLARGWKIGGFEYKPHGLELGDLTGNEFVITLRDCRVIGLEDVAAADKLKKVEQIVSQAASDLSECGYINYYGLQRFGSFQTGTHIIGMKMIQNDLKGAVDSILAYDSAVLPENVDQTSTSKLPNDDIDRADAIRIWRETQNANKARDRMPRRFQAESNIIQYLGRKSDGHKQDKDWQGALMCIQRGLRLMYVHAYQSFVWNHVAVKRREVYGDNVVEGDLVVIGEKDAGVQKASDKTDQDGEVVVHPGAASEEENSCEDTFVRARPLSKEESESGEWDIFDIVLPLPGWDVLYPANEIGKFYEEFMGSEQGGQLDPHHMRRTWKDASLSGGYRKLMSRPRAKVEVTTHLYSGEQQLAETDLDRLSAQPPEPVNYVSNGHASPDAAKVAIVLKLQLGSSQYATMALRELTKGGAVAYRPEFSADRGRGAQ